MALRSIRNLLRHGINTTSASAPRQEWNGMEGVLTDVLIFIAALNMPFLPQHGALRERAQVGLGDVNGEH